MITAPTKVGHRFVTRVVDVLVESRQGPSIATPADDGAVQPETTIVVLTDRRTGAVIELDRAMLEDVCNRVITPAMRIARLIQAQYDALTANQVKNGGKGTRIAIRVDTAHQGLSGITVEADATMTDGSTYAGLVSCGLNRAGLLDFATMHLALSQTAIAA